MKNLQREINKFDKEKISRIKKISKDTNFKKISDKFLKHGAKKKYEYNFDWNGIPIIQYPQDIIALHEIIWKTRPDLIIETGFAHGGSSIFFASMLKLLEYEYGKKGKVLTIDIDFRKHNLNRIKKLKLYKNIKLLKGSSTDHKIFNTAKDISKKFKRILVILDSDHSTNHVYKELEMYSKLVTKNSYCVVFDTGINFWSPKKITKKIYNSNNNPHKAVIKFMKNNNNFTIDEDIHKKLLITSCRDGYLKKIK